MPSNPDMLVSFSDICRRHPSLHVRRLARWWSRQRFDVKAAAVGPDGELFFTSRDAFKIIARAKELDAGRERDDALDMHRKRRRGY